MVDMSKVAGSLVRMAEEIQADRDYKDKAVRIKTVIGLLQTVLKRHAERQKADKTNYGYSGDLGHVLDELRGLVDLLK
jgi:hypothetical protein